MKKIFFVFGFLFLFNLFFLPKTSLAVCSPTTGSYGSCAGASTYFCTVYGNNYCCADYNECGEMAVALPTPFEVGENSKSDSDPTRGCGNGINTAIGCIPVLNNDNGTAFAGFVLKWGIGVGAGIAFILIVYAGFMTMTSQGDPNRLKAGSELMTSAISGLILLIFSIFILKFVGIDILGLDTWGFGQ